MSNIQTFLSRSRAQFLASEEEFSLNQDGVPQLGGSLEAINRVQQCFGREVQ